MMAERLLDSEADQADFQRDGFKIIRGAVSSDVIALVHRYAWLHFDIKGYFDIDPTQADSPARYADGIAETLLVALQPNFEAVCGSKLLPAYSYLRFYLTNARLSRHVDRPACEVSASLTIGYSGDQLWPLYVKSGGREIPIQLDAGDLVVYKGMEVPHWRETLREEYWLQMFFHYVREDGKHTDQQFDGRKRLGQM